MEIRQITPMTIEIAMAKQRFLIDPNFENYLNLPASAQAIQAAITFALVTQIQPPYFSMSHLVTDLPLILPNKTAFLRVQEQGMTQGAYLKGQTARLGKLTLHKIEETQFQTGMLGYLIQAPNEPAIFIASGIDLRQEIFEKIQALQARVMILNLSVNQLHEEKMKESLATLTKGTGSQVLLRLIPNDLKEIQEQMYLKDYSTNGTIQYLIPGTHLIVS